LARGLGRRARRFRLGLAARPPVRGLRLAVGSDLERRNNVAIRQQDLAALARRLDLEPPVRAASVLRWLLDEAKIGAPSGFDPHTVALGRHPLVGELAEHGLVDNAAAVLGAVGEQIELEAAAGVAVGVHRRRSGAGAPARDRQP
jgi:hypothetical protein